MGTALTRAEIPTRDLADRDDVYALLTAFYGRALVDDLLTDAFSDIRARGLESHLPVMCDFWETMLFRAKLYRGSALASMRTRASRARLHCDRVGIALTSGLCSPKL